jgi:hypothetical protein
MTLRPPLALAGRSPRCLSIAVRGSYDVVCRRQRGLPEFAGNLRMADAEKNFRAGPIVGDRAEWSTRETGDTG